METLKIANVRSLLNQEEVKLKTTSADNFNQKFKDDMHASDDEDEEPQIIQTGAETKADYLAGVSKSLEADLHREMLLTQRNLLMKIRNQDKEAKKYSMTNVGFGEIDIVTRVGKGQ